MTDPTNPLLASPSAAETSARQRLVDVAFDLFHERGIHAAPLDEILARSGTGKSQLYHYFGSKDGLVLAVVEEFERRLARGDLPVVQRIDSIDDLAAWFAVFVEFQRSTGCVRNCPVATIATGLSAEQEASHAAVIRIFDAARGVLDRWFVELHDRGALPSDVDPVGLSDFCYAIMQGGLLVSRVRRDVAPFEHAVAHALRHVRDLMDAAPRTDP